jgi:hypothetical protein
LLGVHRREEALYGEGVPEEFLLEDYFIKDWSDHFKQIKS